jgi:hypothetical protein
MAGVSAALIHLTDRRRASALAPRYAPVNRYSVCQASFESVWTVQKSSAILSGSKSVPGLTAPAIVTVAAWMPSSRTPAAISVCAERSAAFPPGR